MKLDWIDPERGPTPQQLGAYADGELSAADRAAVDAWLRRHPARAAEIEAMWRVTQLWRETPPPQPSAEAWSTVRHKIEARLHERPALGHGQETMPQRVETMSQRRPPRGTMPPRRSPRFGLAVAAAAVLALVLLSKGHGPAPAQEEPYPVINAEDVAIMSISGDDCACLVGARPPVSRIDESDLATSDDVLVLNLEPHKDDGTVADLHFENGAPMMVTPPAGWEHDP
jgi:hypothetical protein